MRTSTNRRSKFVCPEDRIPSIPPSLAASKSKSTATKTWTWICPPYKCTWLGGADWMHDGTTYPPSRSGTATPLTATLTATATLIRVIKPLRPSCRCGSSGRWRIRRFRGVAGVAGIDTPPSASGPPMSSHSIKGRGIMMGVLMEMEMEIQMEMETNTVENERQSVVQ